MARDQLIEKTNIPKVREKLLLESGGLSFARVIELPSQVENALAEAQQMARTVDESIAYFTMVYARKVCQEVPFGIPSKRCQSDEAADKSKCSLLSTTRLSRGKICVVIVDFLTILQAVEHVLQNANSANNVASTTILPDVVYLSKIVMWSIVLTAVKWNLKPAVVT